MTHVTSRNETLMYSQTEMQHTFFVSEFNYYKPYHVKLRFLLSERNTHLTRQRQEKKNGHKHTQAQDHRGCVCSGTKKICMALTETWLVLPQTSSKLWVLAVMTGLCCGDYWVVMQGLELTDLPHQT